jgi:hypothetical protein
MGNSQSARRFPALKDARARDPCQEGHARLFNVSCVAIATDPTLAEDEGPYRNRILFCWKPLEEARTYAQTLPLR